MNALGLLPLAGRLAWWGTSWLRGHVGPDDLLDAVLAGDVNGETVPSGFSRIDAFRLGVLSDTDRCFQRFP